MADSEKDFHADNDLHNETIDHNSRSASADDMSQGDIAESSRLLKGVLNVDVQEIGYKDVADELRGIKDLSLFSNLEKPAVVLNIRQSTPRYIVKALVGELIATEQLPAELEDSAVKAVVGSSPALGLALGGDAYAIGRPTLNQYQQSPTSRNTLERSVLHTGAEDTTLHVPGGGTGRPHAGSVNSQREATEQILKDPTSMGVNIAGDQEGGSDVQIRMDPASMSKSEDEIFENSHWQKTIQGPAFLIALGEVHGLTKVVTAFGRLSSAANLGAVNESVTQFVCIVLGPSHDLKETKGAWENARNFASLLSNETFFASALDATDAKDIQEGVKAFVEQNKEVKRRRRSAGGEEPGEIDPMLVKTGKFGGGLLADIKRKLPWYLSDWTDGVVPWNNRTMITYLSATVFMYFSIIMPSISFGALNDTNTDGKIGVMETLFSQAICGAVFALTAGQPLTIIMTTGPLTIYTQVLYSWAEAIGINFLPFYSWVGVWTAVFIMIIVFTDACYLIKYVDAFTEEIFGFLISAIFIGEYIKPLIISRQDDSTEVFLLNLVLATGTYLVSAYLLMAKRSFLLRPIIRTLISDFGAPFAIIAISLLSYAFDVPVEKLPLPTRSGFSTTNGRSWLVPMTDIEIQWIFLAILPAALLVTLFFLDQNISTMLVMKPSNKLHKGGGYNLDLFVVGIMVVFCSVLGLPWCHAALPQSPMHGRSLCDVEEYAAHGRRYERVVKSRETRITGFVTHILIGLSILAKDILNKIPVSVLWGFLLYLGLTSLDGNQMWERVLLLFTQEEKYPPNHYVRRVPIKKIHLYTLLQVVLLVILWFVKANFYLGDTIFNAGLLFPLIIALFVPIREFALPRYYSPRELQALTSEGEDFSNEGINV